MAAPIRTCLKVLQSSDSMGVRRIPSGFLCRCYPQGLLIGGEHSRLASHAAKVKAKWDSKKKGTNLRERSRTFREEYLVDRVPEDDVWIRSFYPKMKFGILDAIRMHKELASPEMMDHMDASLLLDMELNKRTKKKTKFVADISHTMILPHKMEKEEKVKVIVFCKTKEESMYAESRGVVFAGAIDLINMINKGEIHPDEYDYALCTAEMYPDIVPLKKALKHTFPNKKQGTIGADVNSLLDLFLDGCTFESIRITDTASEVQVPIAKLHWSEEQIHDNIASLIDAISKLRSSNHKDIGPFVHSAILTCPSSNERFLLKEDELASCISAQERHILKKSVETEESEN